MTRQLQLRRRKSRRACGEAPSSAPSPAPSLPSNSEPSLPHSRKAAVCCSLLLLLSCSLSSVLFIQPFLMAWTSWRTFLASHALGMNLRLGSWGFPNPS